LPIIVIAMPTSSAPQNAPDPRFLAVLDAVRAGRLDVAAAAIQLRELVAQPLAFATLDHDRATRCGVGEVVFAAGKTPPQVARIVAALRERSPCVLVTRCSDPHVAALREAFPAAELDIGSRCGAVLVGHAPAVESPHTPSTPSAPPPIPIITAGTSDEAVAEEAALTCRLMGRPFIRISDVGVAGLHRLNEHLPTLRQARVIICIAGMEGALPSVIAGLVAVPVIGVPTSVGYGAALAGFTALFSMLTTCAAGVVTVNIDNGFGAAYAACLIDRGTCRGT
jgi:NCAIR mutase (PurE)-related protein